MYDSPPNSKRQSKEDSEYVRLIQDDEPTPTASGWRENSELPSSHSVPSRIVWSIAIPLALILITEIAVGYQYGVTLLKLAPTPESELELRSTYVGLDRLYRSTKPSSEDQYKPIFNRPRVVARVSQLQPNQVSSQDQPRWMSSIGTVTPRDLHLAISSDTNTIYQFRVHDFGMESCQLALRLPPLPSPDDPKSKSWSFPSNIPSNQLDLRVCALDAPKLLDPRQVSWANKPKCNEAAAVIAAVPGKETKLQEFPCSSGTYLAYEVSCAAPGPGCFLDVMSTHNETWGMFMYQYQTI